MRCIQSLLKEFSNYKSITLYLSEQNSKYCFFDEVNILGITYPDKNLLKRDDIGMVMLLRKDYTVINVDLTSWLLSFHSPKPKLQLVNKSKPESFIYNISVDYQKYIEGDNNYIITDSPFILASPDSIIMFKPSKNRRR